jgi:iron complex outermembrane receptor protein
MLNRSSKTLIYVFTTAMLFAVSFCSNSILSATLSGEIIDKTDGGPLLGATVIARPVDPSGKVYTTVTAENGGYEIKNIQPGAYQVSISFVGHTTKAFTLDFESDSTDLTLSADLMPKAIDLNTISVTASRRPEKINDAPASVSVVESEAIEERTTLTLTDHLKGVPSIDIAKTGLNQSNVVARGFNNIFSGALLVLTDNRIARVPSLRYNAYNFIPTVNSDIERIEVVSGPGSALYGPNSAAGVMHIVTKSPFGSEGTTVSVGGGERDLLIGDFRHAGNLNNRIGYKITGQYYQGHDWEHTEETEPAMAPRFRPTSDGADTVVALTDNARDFDTEKLGGEARVDFLIDENTLLIMNGGYNRATGIELTGLGAGQAIDWGYAFLQTRLMYRNLFVQGYVNSSDAGDTYLLNTGQLIVDRSRVWVGQIQHSYKPNDRWLFTYGADAILTRPNTDATINGRNEERDNINEYGAYVQGETQLSDQFKFVGAVRLDDHNQLENRIFSPRAALVYQPDEKNNLRFTYNRAFASPDNDNLFLDILQSVDPFHTGINVRVQGVPETGFHFSTNAAGPQFRSQFAPMVGGQATDYYDYNDTRFTNIAWDAGVELARGGLINTLTTPVNEGGPGLDLTTATAIADAAVSVAPTTITPQGNIMRALDLDTQLPVVVGPEYVADIKRLEPAITQTFELGYKGMFGDRLRFSIDAYRTKKYNFVGPLTVETPNIYLDPIALQTQLTPLIMANYAAAPPQLQAALAALDQNGNGPVDELITLFTTGGTSAAFGSVTPEEALNPTDVLVTYRNFGDISFYGVDLSFAYHLNRNWDFGGSYSYITKNFFARDKEQVHDIYLNAPRNKFGAYLQYNHPNRSFSAQSRVRYVDAFNMVSPFLGSRVKSYVIIDLNAGIDIVSDSRFTVTVQNIFDNKHIEFVGAPELGRLAVARVTQSF